MHRTIIYNYPYVLRTLSLTETGLSETPRPTAAAGPHGTHPSNPHEQSSHRWRRPVHHPLAALRFPPACSATRRAMASMMADLTWATLTEPSPGCARGLPTWTWDVSLSSRSSSIEALGTLRLARSCTSAVTSWSVYASPSPRRQQSVATSMLTQQVRLRICMIPGC